MRIKVEYAAQLKRAAGVGSEEFELDAPGSLRDLVSCIAEKHGDPLSGLLLDDARRLQPSILVFLGNDQVRGEDTPLEDGNSVTFLSPISGG